MKETKPTPKPKKFLNHDKDWQLREMIRLTINGYSEEEAIEMIAKHLKED
jgi:hypothetical protein